MSGECSFARENRSQGALDLSRIDVETCMSIFTCFYTSIRRRKCNMERNGFPDVETTSIHRR
jgi:hypothetical protein